MHSYIPEQIPVVDIPDRITLVCVTNQFCCERIIKAGRIISDLTNTTLNIISVVSPQYPQNPEALEYLYKVSKDNGGQMTVQYSDDPLKAIVTHIKENKTSNVITGVPQSENSVLHTMWSKFTHLTFFMVDEDGEIKEAKSIYQTA